jgi:ATP-binding cassette subfamily B protein
MFQQPVQYNAPVAENIRASDWRIDSPERVEAAGVAAEADDMIRRLPHGYATMLGKWFHEGTELSVGEWQRVALARTYFRTAPLVALDEPTSSMDPWAEARWMERFRQAAAGRTAIVMTHRLTTAKFADIVHVMERGKVMESGSHDELVRADGLYAQAWTAQGRFS